MKKKIKIPGTKKANKTGKSKNEFNKFKNKWKNGNIGEKILTVVMILLVLMFLMMIAFFSYIIISAPEFDADALYTKEASIIYDGEGNEIVRLGTENRERVSYDDLPEVFIDALIATEDSRFFQHNGVDMARFLKATAGQLIGRSGAGGASTLTMQIAKQRINGNEASGIKGIIRKFSDMYVSVFKLEKNYTKEQIIEFYVNIPQFSGNAFGIEQASQKYFGKPISEVTLSEAALLAGLFQAPTAYNPFNNPEKAENRRNQVLNLMQRHGYITKEECELAKKIKVENMVVKNSSSSNEYQGFINTVIEEVKKRTGSDPYRVSMKIYSTMIQSKQKVVNDIYEGKTDFKWADDALQAGIAVTDVKTGALIAVGASRNKGELVYNYATMIKRHPGSAAKPLFDYGPAIEYLNWSTGTTIVDDKYTYSNGLSMKNWDNGYKGIMTVKTALAASRNIPALQAFQAVNQNDINKFVTGLGITPEYDSTGFINESHSIGGFDGVNPVQMSAAYGAFARGGIYIEPYSFTKVEYLDTGEIYTVTPEKRTVMSESTAYMINMILKYAVTSGNVSAGSKSGTDIASKTGTSTVDANAKKAAGVTGNAIGNSWQVSYSPKYVCAVWVGYDKLISKEHHLTSSVGGGARKKLSQLLTKGIQESGYTWKRPNSVVTATIELETIPLQLASDYTPEKLKSVEYFKVGTVPDEVSTRFSQLNNPTNLKVNYLPGSISLSWTPIKTPDAIDKTYLTSYFNDGYKTFAEKYLAKRIEYNEQNIGTIGYHVYISNGAGKYTDLGFTSGSSYTYTGTINNEVTFMVKSSYSKFTANMSSGVTIKVDPTGNILPTPSKDWKVELNGNSKMAMETYYDFINEGNSPVKVMDNGYNVTKDAKIDTVCYKSSDNEEVACQDMVCSQSYDMVHKVTYNNSMRSVSRSIEASC